MNLLPLFILAGVSLGLSCTIFFVRSRPHEDWPPPECAPSTSRRAKPAHFPVSRLPSIWR